MAVQNIAQELAEKSFGSANAIGGYQELHVE
jgi:hypothetical protein